MAKILIADADTDITEILCIILLMQNNRNEIQTASSKDELIKKAGLLMPDLILLDTLLDEGNGRSLCRFIKEYFRGIQVIITSTNFNNLQNPDQCMADDIIEKPFDLKNVVNVVKAHLTN